MMHQDKKPSKEKRSSDWVDGFLLGMMVGTILTAIICLAFKILP